MSAIQTWFITGSSRGFGRALAVAALEAGGRVVATARRPEQLADLAEKYGDRVLPVALDVTDASAASDALEAGAARFGRIDVVVNNAGYANVAPVETTSAEEFRRQFETNFFGVYNVSTAALPILKRQGGGTVIQFSSIGGRVGLTPGLGAYQSAKFAVDGLTRALAAETAPFGIRYLVVEPGGFATDWAGSSMELHGIPEDYRQTVGAFADLVRRGNGSFTAGDPRRAAEILVRVAAREHLPGHLVLGAGAAASAIRYSKAQIAEASTWQTVSGSTDFGAEYPVGLPSDN
ncbi:SDR family NAD(P)-dependent oxidoreductase [Streptomyces sp. NPDC047002]|uniref:SDR family NAD(P)-dependent oxidoreductase n=1 Tax=Streptomyces sp. NPDC047002 TaxID=3155475 RepID=UPI003454EDF4